MAAQPATVSTNSVANQSPFELGCPVGATSFRASSWSPPYSRPRHGPGPEGRAGVAHGNEGRYVFWGWRLRDLEA